MEPTTLIALVHLVLQHRRLVGDVLGRLGAAINGRTGETSALLPAVLEALRVDEVGNPDSRFDLVSLLLLGTARVAYQSANSVITQNFYCPDGWC